MGIDIKKVPVKTVTVVLEAADFTEGEEPVVGLSLTVKTSRPLGVQKDIEKMNLAQNLTDGFEAFKLLERGMAALASTITDWNLTDGDEKLPITAETLDALPAEVFQAVGKANRKALESVKLDPNSKSS